MQLAEALDASLQKSPGNILEAFTTFLHREERHLVALQQGNPSGLDVCRRRAALIDTVVGKAFDMATEEYAAKNPSDSSRCALVAVGGYGRGEMNFHSDIDLLFLVPDRVHDYAKHVLNKILYLLWDLGMIVGHSTRTISDAVQMCATDITTRTALFETRFLRGDAFLHNHLSEKLELRFARVPRVISQYVALKTEEREERHARFGATMYLQEPNVKESIGGIRDLHNVLWIMRLKYGSTALRLLARHHLLEPAQTQALHMAFDFMLAVRNQLHLCAGKKLDILMRQYQPRVAAALGFQSHGRRTASEVFMRRYYLAARTISFLSSAVLAKTRTASWRQRSMQFFTRKDLGHGLAEAQGYLHAQRDPRRFVDRPLLLLETFKIAQQRDLVLDAELQDQIRRHLYLVGRSFRRMPEALAIFRSILACKGRVAPTLRCMHEVGILGKLIPEWAHVTCHVQDSDYHHYTTDEHSLKAIEFVDRLFTPSIPVLRSLHGAAERLARPDLLYLALILHDVGKLDTEDHVSLSLVLAEKVYERMRLTEKERQLMTFLIREHLTMSHTAQRRDVSDNRTILDFAGRVKNVENLRALTVLTYADANAVGPGIWTDWKEMLILELFGKTEEWLSGKAPPLRPTKKMREEMVAKVLACSNGGMTPREILAHLDAMPTRYPVFTSPELISTHVALSRGLGRNMLTISHCPSQAAGTVSEVTVCARDRAGLFTAIAGCFTLNGINIIGAQICTRSDNVVLDTFRVCDEAQTVPIQERVLQRFEAQLRQALDGSLDLQQALDMREKQTPPHPSAEKIAPVVLIDNSVSETTTVIEIQALDRPGFLFRISKALAGLHLNIVAAKISTERLLTYDVFYVTDKKDQKLAAPSHPRIQGVLRAALQP